MCQEGLLSDSEIPVKKKVLEKKELNLIENYFFFYILQHLWAMFCEKIFVCFYCNNGYASYTWQYQYCWAKALHCKITQIYKSNLKYKKVCNIMHFFLYFLTKRNFLTTKYKLEGHLKQIYTKTTSCTSSCYLCFNL